MTKEEMRFKVLELAVGSAPSNFGEHIPRAQKYLEFVIEPVVETQKEIEVKETKISKKVDNPKVLP